MSFTLNEINRVSILEGCEIAVVNELFVVALGSDEWELIDEYKAQTGSNIFDSLNEAEQQIAEPFIVKHEMAVFLNSWRQAGAQILQAVDFILLNKLPTPEQAIANLQALDVIEKLLFRGNLNGAKTALQAADLTGTSFDGDSDSFDEIMAMIDAKIAELTP